ncbi:MAG: site-2 protease family protein [Bacilli bacterium]|nr:site-2 protease family protein [Bacilli bacterium]
MMVVLASASSFGQFLLNLLLFIVALGLLVTIHEAGHFSMAKLFNVYCNEFSIGFGPKIFGKKRKNGETEFSIRVIPLGGYVSMYGEGMELPSGVDIPKERSLEGTKKWKRAIIMAAGIVLNFILGFVLFSINTVFFPQSFGTSQLVVDDNGLAALQGMNSNDYVDKIISYQTINGVTSDPITTQVNGAETGEYYALASALSLQLPEMGTDVTHLEFYMLTMDSNTQKLVPSNLVDGENKPYVFNLTVVSTEENGKTTLSWEKMGISIYTFQARLSFGKAMKYACIDFADSTTAIAKSLGGLFVGKGWKDIGGPVAIFQVSSQVRTQYGFGMYLKLWGMISVNLALFNLLPFPGLDGWHLLVVIIESITRKEIPQKVKGIVSAIGLCLLFALMGVILIKDIFF